MARQRHLNRAPIVEALIDFQVVPRAGQKFADFESALVNADPAYYLKGPIAEGTFGFHLPVDGTQPHADAQSEQMGLRMHSHGERYVVQHRLRGLTVSQLAPYREWSELREETKRVWELYVDKVRPQRIARVAVRYINNLRLPLFDDVPFQKYIEKLVDVPAAVPQRVSSFFQRFQLRDEEGDFEATITLALDPRQSLESTPVILDIEAFKTIDIDVGDGVLWTTMEQLRELKNRCFFGIVTEAAVELYA